MSKQTNDRIDKFISARVKRPETPYKNETSAASTKYDSDEDTTVFYGKPKADKKQEVSDEFVVLGQTTSFQVEDDANTGFYGINDEFDPSAPYYNETLVQWRLGSNPFPINGAKIYTIRLGNVVNEATLQQYLDAGLVQLKLLNLNIDLVPAQFLHSTTGVATVKVVQGDYFDTQIHKIYETSAVELSEEVTGLLFTIDALIPIADLLQTPICSITYKWYGVRLDPEPATPIFINQMMNITTTMSTTLAPFVDVTRERVHSLPAKFH